MLAVSVVALLISHINIYMSTIAAFKLFKIDASNASGQTGKKEVQDNSIIDCFM